jgi:hypothetical protein
MVAMSARLRIPVGARLDGASNSRRASSWLRISAGKVIPALLGGALMADLISYPIEYRNARDSVLYGAYVQVKPART